MKPWSERRFVTVKEVCAEDGPFDGIVKKDAIYSLVKSGLIRSVRVGGATLVLRESVDAYIMEQLSGAQGHKECADCKLYEAA
jgi:excisionase family DNA binding protein